MTEIRVAVEADVEALFEVRTSVRENLQERPELAALGVTPESVAEMLRTTARAWLAEEGERAVGFAMADAAQGTLFALFVRPEHEGRGVGAALLRRAERWLFEQGWPEIWLLTGGEPALRAHGFYRGMGWTAVGTDADGQVRYVRRRQDAASPPAEPGDAGAEASALDS